MTKICLSMLLTSSLSSIAMFCSFLGFFSSSNLPSPTSVLNTTVLPDLFFAKSPNGPNHAHIVSLYLTGENLGVGVESISVQPVLVFR
ncbi:hypothetical protein GQ44DRAFT_697007, partial [Phaeosphaeriaceae sp. PMI808]